MHSIYIRLYYCDCTTHRTIVYLRMCNMMYYNSSTIIFVFIQVATSDSRQYRACSAGLSCRGLANLNSLPGHTLHAKNLCSNFASSSLSTVVLNV